MGEPKNKKEDKRDKIYPVRFTESEFLLLEKRFSLTTHRTLADYTRTVLLKGRVKKIYIDKTKETLLDDLARIYTQVQTIGRNFNQLVKKISSFKNPTLKSQDSENLERIKNELESISSSIKEIHQETK